MGIGINIIRMYRNINKKNIIFFMTYYDFIEIFGLNLNLL